MDRALSGGAFSVVTAFSFPSSRVEMNKLFQAFSPLFHPLSKSHDCSSRVVSSERVVKGMLCWRIFESF